MLLHISQRAEQSLFLARPQRHPHRAPRLHPQRLDQPRGLQHDGAADRIVGRSGSRMPGIQVPAQHHHFIRLVRARDLADHVVAGPAFRIHVVDDVELELHVFAVGQQPFDPAVIVVAHDHRRDRLLGIVRAMLLGHDDAFPARRIVQPHHRAAREQHGVDALSHLRRRQPVGIRIAAPPRPPPPPNCPRPPVLHSDWPDRTARSPGRPAGASAAR